MDVILRVLLGQHTQDYQESYWNNSRPYDECDSLEVFPHSGLDISVDVDNRDFCLCGLF